MPCGPQTAAAYAVACGFWAFVYQQRLALYYDYNAIMTPTLKIR